MVNLAPLSFSYYKDLLDSTVPTLSYLNMLMDCNDSLRSSLHFEKGGYMDVWFVCVYA